MNILIVEDERMIARRLERILRSRFSKSGAHIETLSNLSNARDQLSRSAVDLLLLDLNLNGEDGFRLLAEAVAGPQQTIVVSANADRAIEAFDYGVVDFVAKPFDEPRVELAIDRAMGKTTHNDAHLKLLSFRTQHGVELIKTAQVVSIHGAGDYSEVETLDGRSLLHDKTLTRLEQQLADHFLRVHRSHIVNLNHVSTIVTQPGSRYSVLTVTDNSIPVSRAKIKALRSMMR